MSPPRVSGIVLAGGRSTRFGGDKLAAQVGGRPLLHLAIDAVAAVADEVVVVVGADAPGPPLPRGVSVPIVVARDAAADQGPVAGLAAGLASASHPLALLAGGDQPALRPELLRELLRGLAPGAADPPLDVIGLEDDGRLRPLPVALRVATAGPAAEVALTGGTRSLVGLFGRLRAGMLDPVRWRELDPAGDSLRDVDTRDDLQPSWRAAGILGGSTNPGHHAELPVTISSLGPFAEPIHTRGAWGAWWRGWYRLLRMFGSPLGRLATQPGFGNLVLLRVVGRRSGSERSLPLGLLTVEGRRYLGHPSGDTSWTLNLRAAASATIESARIPRTRVRPVLLGPGTERDGAVRASFRQHPFPGNAIYRLAGRHVEATGVFFRLEPVDAAPVAPDAPPPGDPT